MTQTIYFTTPAIAVEQEVGTFFAAAIPANILLDVCFSDEVKAIRSVEDGYSLDGSQRMLDPKRLREIGKFLETSEAGFPNAVILAANFRSSDGMIEQDESTRWSVEMSENGCWSLSIPTDASLAAIIDGQHRIFGFTEADEEVRNMPVLCSIFLDLPKPFQAYLFATINSTQKQVNRSLTYELFGYNIEEEPSNEWSPDKLAVFLSRRLNTDESSPFEHRILVTPQNDISLSRAAAREEGKWMVSMATIVDGILALISTNPKRDALNMRKKGGNHTRKALDEDNSPLREIYREGNDQLLYTLVKNYFSAVFEIVGQTSVNARADHPLTKTIGIQAAFDILRRELAETALTEKKVSKAYFLEKMAGLRRIDFEKNFELSSGAARTSMRQHFYFVVLGKEPDNDANGEKLASIENNLLNEAN